jgi:hypothetical protein
MCGLLQGREFSVRKHIASTIGIRIQSRWIEEPLRQNVEKGA